MEETLPHFATTSGSMIEVHSSWSVEKVYARWRTWEKIAPAKKGEGEGGYPPKSGPPRSEKMADESGARTLQLRGRLSRSLISEMDSVRFSPLIVGQRTTGHAARRSPLTHVTHPLDPYFQGICGRWISLRRTWLRSASRSRRKGEEEAAGVFFQRTRHTPGDNADSVWFMG